MSVLLTVLLLLAPVKVERGRFVITKDGKTIGTDEFSISKRGPGYFLEGKTTIGDLVISSQMELDEKASWNKKYSEGSHSSLEPDPFLVSAYEEFVADGPPGAVLDVAGGVGRPGPGFRHGGSVACRDATPRHHPPSGQDLPPGVG